MGAAEVVDESQPCLRNDPHHQNAELMQRMVSVTRSTGSETFLVSSCWRLVARWTCRSAVTTGSSRSATRGADVADVSVS